jgi:hypothetical protein
LATLSAQAFSAKVRRVRVGMSEASSPKPSVFPLDLMDEGHRSSADSARSVFHEWEPHSGPSRTGRAFHVTFVIAELRDLAGEHRFFDRPSGLRRRRARGKSPFGT